VTLERQLPAAVSNTSDAVKRAMNLQYRSKWFYSCGLRIPMFAMILTSVHCGRDCSGRQRVSHDHRRMGASRGKIRRRRSASDDDPQRQQQSRRTDAGQARGREFFGKAYRRPRRRGACDARIYPARSRQHHNAQARRISRDVAADAATRHRRQIHVFDRFSKGWNDRKGGARSLVTLNVVAAGRIGLKPRQPVPDRRPTS
jgi:hypothetical protein